MRSLWRTVSQGATATPELPPRASSTDPASSSFKRDLSIGKLPVLSRVARRSDPPARQPIGLNLKATLRPQGSVPSGRTAQGTAPEPGVPQGQRLLGTRATVLRQDSVRWSDATDSAASRMQGAVSAGNAAGTNAALPDTYSTSRRVSML